MSTSWSGQICNGEGKYYIQFETDNKELYRLVESTCQNAMDIDRKPESLNMFNPSPLITDFSLIPESCLNCPNHPSNGGSGICNCTLGQYSINTIPRAPETICESKTVTTNKLTNEEFIKTYCHNCGSQRCEGIGTVWFQDCKYRNRLKTFEF